MREKSENAETQRFVSTGEAMKRLGLCGQTLRKYAKLGLIDHIRTEGGPSSKFRFDVDGYLARKVNKANAG